MVPNKLIQLLFTVETKLRSEHSSPVTKKPDLVCKRGNVRFGEWAAIQLVNPYLQSKLFHTPFENKRQRGTMDLWKAMDEMQLFKHLPPTDHFLSTGVALLGRNEIICPTTTVQSRGAQSLASLTTVRFMFLPPKPRLSHFGEGWIWGFSRFYFGRFCFGREGWHCCGFGFFSLQPFRIWQLVSIEWFKTR